jgi:2'-5' RNA ligase
MKWVDPESIHLTLDFLGSILPSRSSEILAAIGPVVRQRKPFGCGVGGLGAFPGIRGPRVLWLGVDARGTDLEALVIEIENALEPLGFPRERRPFRPHLTLARSRRKGVAAAAVLEDRDVVEACRDLGRLPIEVVHLYRSEPGAGGPRYTPLGSLPLGRAAGSSPEHTPARGS